MTRMVMKTIALISVFILVFSVGACVYAFGGEMGGVPHAHNVSIIQDHINHARSLTIAIISWFLLFGFIYCSVILVEFLRVQKKQFLPLYVVDDGVRLKLTELYYSYKKLRSPPIC